AAALHRALKRKLRLHVPVIITDSFGRPWREGLTEVAIGVAGLKPLHDCRDRRDLYGYRLRVTVDAVADEIAAAAGLVTNKLSRAPVCLVRGFRYQRDGGRARQLVRPARRDLFR
ncbi:MAG: coenzyme F420-0:L-glutamate ligase, partial [Terriglobia bacterium]